jgi:RNA polymerase sigma-70 factor (ECF subfamily)
MNDAFAPERPRLLGLAYKMLGSFAEAEDVVQDAYLRWSAVDREQVHDPASYLSTTVARLCLDRLKSARAKRETYFGTWLPEPVLDGAAGLPDAGLELADDLSFALFLTLERLSPPERTAFLLHDVFGMEFEGVAQVLERTSAACRKLAERAREQVHAGRARFSSTREEEQRLFEAFVSASYAGDTKTLAQLLAADAVLYTDGGGKRKATAKPVYGAERVARFFTGVAKHPHYEKPTEVIPRRVNQLPGCLMRYANGDVMVFAFEPKDGVIARIYIVSNPDKLRHLAHSDAPSSDS